MSKFGEHADRIGHWNEGPETFIVIKAKNVQLGVQTYGPPLPDLSQETFIKDMKILEEKSGWSSNQYEDDKYTFDETYLIWLQGKQS